MVIGETTEETRPVFEQKAKDKNAPITFAEDKDNREVLNCKPIDEGGINYDTRHFGTLHGELGGEYQKRNTNTILCAVDQLMKMGVIKTRRACVKDLQMFARRQDCRDAGRNSRPRRSWFVTQAITQEDGSILATR